MKEKIILAVSLVVGVLALLLTAQYFKNKDKEYLAKIRELYRGAQKVEVIVAAHDIPSGTVLTREDLGYAEKIKSHIRANTVTKAEAGLLLGRKTAFEITAMNPVFWTDIEGGARRDQGLSSIITHGMRAISLAVGGASAVSGMLQPNDRIDLLGTFSFPSKTVPGEMEMVTLTILQDVTILATGQTLAKQQTGRDAGRKSRGSGYNTVTLEVTPAEAELLVFAQQINGRITLALRNSSDTTWKRDLPSVDFSHLQFELPKLNMDRQRNIRHKKDI